MGIGYIFLSVALQLSVYDPRIRLVAAILVIVNSESQMILKSKSCVPFSRVNSLPHPFKLLPQWKCCDVFVYVMIYESWELTHVSLFVHKTLMDSMFVTPDYVGPRNPEQSFRCAQTQHSI